MLIIMLRNLLLHPPGGYYRLSHVCMTVRLDVGMFVTSLLSGSLPRRDRLGGEQLTGDLKGNIERNKHNTFKNKILTCDVNLVLASVDSMTSCQTYRQMYG